MVCAVGDVNDQAATRGLSFVDWAGVADVVGAEVDEWVARGASHLICDAGLRQILIGALLDAGVQATEMALDVRADGARVDLWLDLESGITHAIAVVGSRAGQQSRQAAAALWRAWSTTARHVAHERLVVALVHDRVQQHLARALAAAGSRWPAMGHEQEFTVEAVTTVAGVPIGRTWQNAALACLADRPSASHHLLVTQITPRTPPQPVVEVQAPLVWWTR